MPCQVIYIFNTALSLKYEQTSSSDLFKFNIHACCVLCYKSSDEGPCLWKRREVFLSISGGCHTTFEANLFEDAATGDIIFVL